MFFNLIKHLPQARSSMIYRFWRILDYLLLTILSVPRIFPSHNVYIIAKSWKFTNVCVMRSFYIFLKSLNILKLLHGKGYNSPLTEDRLI